MVTLMSWIHPEMSRESIFLIVGVLFGIVLWPLLFLLMPAFLGVQSGSTGLRRNLVGKGDASCFCK